MQRVEHRGSRPYGWRWRLGMISLDRLEPWLYRVALASCIAMGIVFRSIRYWKRPIGLWLDEAWWAEQMLEQPLTAHKFRPIGYMALSRWIAGFYISEPTLRILSWLAGITSLFIAAYCASRLFRSRLTRILCLFVLAFQPVLIDMAREFKPYSLEFCLHLSLPALYLRWRETQARRWLWGLLAAPALWFPMAYNIAFALPGLFMLLGIELLRRRRFQALAAVAGSAALTLLLMSAIYLTVIQHMDLKAEEAGWGKSYDVFYVHDNPGSDTPARQSRASWFAQTYLEVAAFPGIQRNYWKPPPSWSQRSLDRLRSLDRGGWVALHFSALLLLLYQRRFRILGLFVSPFVVAIVFNVIGLWPFGVFRANTFLLAYLVIIPMFALDALLASSRLLFPVGAVFGFALMLAPNLTIGRNDHSGKYALMLAPTFPIGRHERDKYANEMHFEMNALMGRLSQLYELTIQRRTNGEVLVLLDTYSCPSAMFYAKYHDGFKERWGETAKRFHFGCWFTLQNLFGRMRRVRNQTFFVVTTPPRNLDSRVLQKADVVAEGTVPDTPHAVYLLKRKARW